MLDVVMADEGLPRERKREFNSCCRCVEKIRNELFEKLEPGRRRLLQIPAGSASNEERLQFCTNVRKWCLEELDEQTQKDVRNLKAYKNGGPRHKSEALTSAMLQVLQARPGAFAQFVVKNGFLEWIGNEDERKTARRAESADARSGPRPRSRSRSRRRKQA
mmetsp:Transcript_108649/g.249051  ORF Transcript_108649/g.249051 Transcript_108649/m.249051 type:complete len:162 (-) Transcript_108649:76-561(-)